MWSKDGKTIAFESNRFGNSDIFLVPFQGGLPKRLTYHSAGDYITDYTDNGDILFSTRRDFAQVERESEVFIVNEKGGTPYRFLSSLGFDATLSPNGKFIAFTKGSCRIAREAYRGPAQRDIWLYDIKKDSYTQLTTYDGNDFSPKWANNNTIYFQSSRSGKYNVHKLSINDSGAKIGSVSQVTSLNKFGLFSFNLSKNGNDLIAVSGDEVYMYNIATASLKEVKINIGSDYRFDPIVHKQYSSGINSVAVSANGKYSALEIRGEIFLTENDKDRRKTVNVSTSAYRDRMPTWVNDSTLLFVSDRDGQYDFYLLKSDDPKESNLFKTLKHKVIRLTKTSENETDPVISPDGNLIAYQRGRGELVVASINGDKLSNEKVLLNGWSSPSNIAWSPDSIWLSYGLPDLEFNDEIYIHKADNSMKPVNVSMHPKQDRGAIWSPDGKKLIFSSDRSNGDFDVWFVWLNKKDWQKTPQDWEEEASEENKSKDKKSDKKDDKKKDAVEPITIDFDNIYERQVQVTNFIGGELACGVTKDGETIYYVTGNVSRTDAEMNSDLYKIKWNGKDKKEITSGNSRPSNISQTKDYSHLYLTKSGTLNKLNLAGDKMESLPVAAKMDVDYITETNQIFEEAWKAINDGFYDPNFHGQDWGKLKEKYKPLALKASTRDDFQYIFNLMLGQINASHMGLNGGENREDLQAERTGLLGVELKPQSNGSLVVTAVTSDMPADREVSKLNTGDIITAVNGVELSANTNVYSLFEGTANDKIYLSVTSNGASKEVFIRPQTSNRNENYYAWVKEQKQLTEKYSGGKLGYIHIQGMDWTSFETFERELTAAGLGKEGIVIDVRFNGGGWTTDYLMAVLTVKQHAYTVPRGATNNLERDHTKFKDHYPYSERLPLAAWTKPSIALCNETSYSNAEIFSHAYKSLGIGTLVGVPTFGAVISTGATRLIDGSFVRMPFRGWYVKSTEKNMELGPAVPDVIVYNNPDDKAKASDSQLKKAVEILLSQLKK